MYVGVIRSPLQEELSCKYATAFSFKRICKTDTNVSSFFFGEDIQVLVRYTTFREHASKTAFYRRRIPEPSYLKKETLDIDILLRSNNSNRKIMQPITMSHPSSLVKIFKSQFVIQLFESMRQKQLFTGEEFQSLAI